MSYQMMTKQQQAGSAGVSLKELQAQVAMLMQQNAALAAMVQERASGRVTLKIGPSGTIGLIGMGRNSPWMYPSQWDKLLGMADEIKAFIEANRQYCPQVKGDKSWSIDRVPMALRTSGGKEA